MMDGDEFSHPEPAVAGVESRAYGAILLDRASSLSSSSPSLSLWRTPNPGRLVFGGKVKGLTRLLSSGEEFSVRRIAESKENHLFPF